MGDFRYRSAHRRLAAEKTPGAAVGRYSDAELIQVLAAESRTPYLANVAASELLNRLRGKNAVLAVASEGFAVLDADGAIRFTNPAADRLLGTAAVPSRSFHDVVHAHLGEAHGRCGLALGLASRRSLSVEQDTFLGADGAAFPASYTANPILRGGEVEGYVVVFRDGSRLRGLLGALEAAEARAEAAFRLARIGRWDWDAESDALVWSDETYRIFHRKPQEFGGHLGSFFAWIPREDRRRVAEALRRAASRDEEFVVRHRVALPDRSTVLVETRGGFRYDREGVAISAWGTHQDVGARLAGPLPPAAPEDALEPVEDLLRA